MPKLPAELNTALLTPAVPNANVPEGPSNIKVPESERKEPYGPDAPNLRDTAAVPLSYRYELSFPIKMPPPALIVEVELIDPTTSSVLAGAAVPMPTRPVEVMRIRSEPPARNLVEELSITRGPVPA
jgi:hypothetical protein